MLTCSGRVKPHASHSQAQSVTKPQMGGLPTDDFCHVRWFRRCLKGEHFSIGELPMKIRP